MVVGQPPSLNLAWGKDRGHGSDVSVSGTGKAIHFHRQGWAGKLLVIRWGRSRKLALEKRSTYPPEACRYRIHWGSNVSHLKWGMGIREASILK